MGYCPTVARWHSRDPLDTEEVTLLDPPTAMYPYPHLTVMAARDGHTAYTYAGNNPLLFTDPSGLACISGLPPEKMQPVEDTYFPVPYWKQNNPPDIRFGTRLSLEGRTTLTFPKVECDCCEMDIEIQARAFRFFRAKGDLIVNYRGVTSAGLGSDRRDFFSVVVVTVCKSSIVCGKVKKPDSREVIVSRVFQKHGLGVYIRSADGLEPASESFKAKDDQICNFAEEYLSHLWRNTQVTEVPGDPETIPPPKGFR